MYKSNSQHIKREILVKDSSRRYGEIISSCEKRRYIGTSEIMITLANIQSIRNSDKGLLEEIDKVGILN